MSSSGTQTPGMTTVEAIAGKDGGTPKAKGIVDADTLATLLAPAACAVSIYLSAGVAEHDRGAPDARLRSLIQLADERLARRGMELRVRDAFLEPMRRFAADADFTRHRDPCLALFTRGDDAPDENAPATGMTIVPLPWAQPDQVRRRT